MPEPREPRSIIEAAEQAAAAGNYSTAEALLREAAAAQEARLGPLHPDLANTLNNLGVVCEITGNLVEAERSFRRAFAIATTVLEPDHPFVATSRKNLCDFCEVRGTPIELPPSSPPVTAQATPSMEPLRESQTPAESKDVQQPLGDARLFRRFVIGGLGPIAMLMVVLAAGLPKLSSTEGAASSSAIAIDAPREIPAPPIVPSSVDPVPLPEVTKDTGSVADGVSVIKARLCADLDEWRCDPPDDPVPTGPLFFYTQVTSTSAITVQHRWYRDNRLNHSVDLPLQPSPTIGYRSFSRNTMNSDSVGNWRVELRTEDGVLLHEERFSVR
jgi:Protein of unknown function (DUF2914)/Tetratricopeptide repeat